MSDITVTLLCVMVGAGGICLLAIGRRHGRRAQLLPLPQLLLIVAMASGPVFLIGPLAVLWVVPAACYAAGQWLGLQASALQARRGKSDRKVILRALSWRHPLPFPAGRRPIPGGGRGV